MPTYDYVCPRGHEFELVQKMSDDPVAACPECGEQAERRISGGGGLLFKGGGFYVTDYRSEDYKKKASAEKTGGEPAKAQGKAGSGGDAKAPSPGGS